MRRPNLLVAHWEGFPAFDDADLDRLDEVGRLLTRETVSSWSDARVRDLLGEVEVIVGHWGCPPLDEEMLARAPKLKLYAHAAGTVKGTITPAAWDRGILVTSGANANAEPVAEYTLAAILFANKDIFWSAAAYRNRDLENFRPPGGIPVGNWGKTVGIVGASLIGRRVIELLGTFPALRVAVYDPYLTEADAMALGVAKMGLDELCAAVDILSIHAPALPSTDKMIGPGQLAALRDGVTLINTARGSLVDADALLAELESGRINAVLDVTDPEPLPEDSPLPLLPNVFLTPHQAGSLGTELARMVDFVIAEVRRYAAGEPPLNPVTKDRLDLLA